MRLRVEPPAASRESYSGVLPQQTAGSELSLLPCTLPRQALANWCWAAIAVAMADFYGTGPIEQHVVASAVLGFDTTDFREHPALAARCDVYAVLDQALQVTGCYSHWSPGKPTFARIRNEIDAGRPVCPGIDWHQGGTHYMVVTGYYADSCEVYVQDSLHGPSVQRFDTFPSRYRGGGLWRGTFWTCPRTNAEIRGVLAHEHI